MEDPQIPIPTPITQTQAPCWSSIVKSQPQPKQPNQNLTSTVTNSVFSNGVFTESSTKGAAITVAVVDANAVIQGGEKLSSCADKFVSVSEVIDEIRDPVSRRKLDILPFSIDVMEPSPESMRKVINFARGTGDLQTLSDVDIKLIALTFTLEAQIHGTKHLRECPPPIHMVNVKKLPEKDLPGWGSNVANIEEWDALEQETEEIDLSSKILPLKVINMNVGSDDRISETGSENRTCDLDDGCQVQNSSKPRKYFSKKKEVNIEGKIVAAGVDASQGQCDDNDNGWLPAVSRTTHRRFLRRQSRREVASQHDVEENMEGDAVLDNNDDEDISIILEEIKLKEQEANDENLVAEREETEMDDYDSNHLEISSENGESVDASFVDDNSSEQSWMLRSLSESSVACITGDFAMQNVILQMGLRLVAPGGMQIRQLNRWILKCHACYEVTTEIGRIFCPKCGNGGTLRKVAVTVGENGVVLASRKPRVSLRGTKFSLPLPQSGRDAIAKNPILREDQLPHKVLYPKRRNKMNKEGDELFAAEDMFRRHNSDKKAALKPPVGKALAVFTGRRNPNDNHYSRVRV